MRDAALLRSLLQAVVTADDAAAAAAGQNALAALESALKGLSARLLDSSTALGPAIQPILRGCQTLEDAVRLARAEIAAKVWLDKRQEWRQVNDVVVSRIIDRLAEIR